MQKNIFIFILSIVLFCFSFVNKSYANMLFNHSFNGGGTLENYNTNYHCITDFATNTCSGTFSLNLDHVYTSGFDPGYVYTGIPSSDNVCTSIDFGHWGYASTGGGWTNLFFHSTANDWGQEFKVWQNGDNQTGYTYLNKNSGLELQGLVYFDVNQNHTLKACISGTLITGYLDGTLIYSNIDTNIINNGGFVGFASQYPTNYLDNFTITSVNQSSDLSVPLFKQTSNPWQSQEYDTAHLWNPGDPTINSWGCAMTSAAMIFKYHGIDKLPDGASLDPGSLNAWLKNQPDGYVGTGWVNWLALSRLSKLATSINNITSFDALEYHRIQGDNIIQLTNDLNNNLPDILEEPGHFIVAKGINGNTFDINDPYFSLTSLDNSRYNNTFLSMGRYVPSMTDLSYIMLTADPNITLTIRDQQGNIVGSSFIQSSIIAPTDGTTFNQPLNIYYVPQPDSGKYTITETNSSKPFQFSAYLYNVNGNPKIQTLGGFGDANYTIFFDKTNSDNSTITKTATFASVIQDIKNAQNNNVIDNGLAIDLLESIKNTQKIVVKDPSTAKNLLNNGIKKLNNEKTHPQRISADTYLLLFSDFTSLINSF